MRMLRSALLVFLLGVIATPAAAAPITIDFEDLLEFDDVGDHYTGVTFTGATVLTAGSSLNEFDTPPNSGFNAVIDSEPTGIRIDFDGNGVSLVRGNFTYAEQLTLTAYSGAVMLGTALSTTTNNLQTFGGSANEAIQFQAGLDQAITHVIITAGELGQSFILDDLFAETIEGGGGGTDPNNPVPEPATVTLMLLGAAIAAGRQKLRARRQAHV
jgi:hypothetical protein